MGFTPGPWKVCKEDEDCFQIDHEEYIIPYGYCTATLAEVYGKENARLISAAPDMYHALECALAVLKEECPDEAAVDIVEKALEKAGGRD